MKISTVLLFALAAAGGLALSTPAEAQQRRPGSNAGSSMNHGGNFGRNSGMNRGNWHHGDWHHGYYPRGHVNVYFGGFGYPYYYGNPFFGYPYYGWGYPYGGYYGYYAPAVPTYSYDPQGIYNGRVVSGAGGNLSLTAQVQQNLAQGGYYHGTIDGIIGDGTRSAIRRYQRDHGLRVDGHIDGQLLGNMGLGEVTQR